MENDFSREFQLNDGIYYLNHAAVAPWPKRTSEAVKAFAEENLHQGAANYPQWMEIEQQLRERCRQLINAASTDDIALVKNTSEALSMVAHGLDWQPGDNVVTAREEFPSNRMVWESLARYGVETRFVSLSENTEDPETALLSACDENTRLLSISAVQYANGLKMDLERLGKALKPLKTLFCVDAIQQIGALPLDVKAIHADFVMADGHKWMLAPEGLAIFWTHEKSRNLLRINEFGWHMAEKIHDFDSLEWEIAQSGRRFECGSPNMLGIFGMNASLSLLLEVGMHEVSRNLIKKTSYLIDLIENDSSLELLSSTQSSRQSGIVTFRHTSMDSHSLFTQLRDKGVVCAERGGGIRFSPHFYTPEDIMSQAMKLTSSL